MNTPGAEALYFGPAEARLFGWLHRPAASADVGLALVICNPFGFEEVCAHRALRDLAQAAAEAGVPTLRFDYAGCGNSDGDDAQANMLERWLASVHCAVDAVKHASGARQVCLFGVRLGALLATLAASSREDVRGLVAVAPVLRGRLHLRELTVLARTGIAAPQATGDGRLESAGFVLSAATCGALSAVDLRTLLRPPAPRVLVVERDDLPDAVNWAPVLERLGAEVISARWPGYAAMVDDPQRAVTPQRIVVGVVDTLAAWQAGMPHTPAAAAAWGTTALQPSPAAAEGPASTEAPVHIDVGGSSLFAVLHRPVEAAGAASGPRPAVLMLNSGSVHSIGPNRLWVRLARRWAGQGLLVMRLDIAGIGDSAARSGAPDNVVYSPHAMADVAAALDHLRTREGAGPCHVMGLCSGAYHAFKAATTGLPVASALMINPLTYFWEQGTRLTDIKDYEVIELADKYRTKLFTRQPWQRLLRGDLHLSLIATVAWRRLAHVAHLGARELARWLRLPLKDDLARELRSAVRAHVGLRFVFASNAPGHTLLQQQSGRALARLIARGGVAIEFVADADHTFTQADARERLVRVLDAAVQRVSGVAAAR